jgi:hypothetical protein
MNRGLNITLIWYGVFNVWDWIFIVWDWIFIVWNGVQLWSGTKLVFGLERSFIFSGTGFIFCLERSSYFAWNGALEMSFLWSGTELTCFSIFAAEPGGGVPVPAGGAGETLWALPHSSPPGRESQGSEQVPTPAGELKRCPSVRYSIARIFLIFTL